MSTSDPARVRGARDALLRELASIERAAAQGATGRCPYRGMHDACSFGYGCRNQRRGADPRVRCAGGTLNAASVRP